MQTLTAITFARNSSAFARIDVLPPHVPMELAAMATAHGLDRTFAELYHYSSLSPVDDLGLIPAGRGCWISPEVLRTELHDVAHRFGWQATTSDLLLGDTEPEEDEEDEEDEEGEDEEDEEGEDEEDEEGEDEEDDNDE